MTTHKFNPDYLCDDPSCKSREIIRDVIAEHDDAIQEARGRADTDRAIIEELVSALDDLIKSKPESWMIENAQTALSRARRHLINQAINKFECRTCGAQSIMDPPDCPRGAVHCDVVEID